MEYTTGIYQLEYTTGIYQYEILKLLYQLSFIVISFLIKYSFQIQVGDMPRRSKPKKEKVNSKDKESKTKSKKTTENKIKSVNEKPDARKRSTSKESKKEDSVVDEQKPPKFRFECQLCGYCCGNETINITISDLDRWVADNTIYRILHLLKLDEAGGRFFLIFKKDDDGMCNLYHRDNKKCMIYDTRPLYCRAYPLGFNGENYYLRSKECVGLNKGKMTKEQLEVMRNSAFDEYIANRMSERVIPTLQRVIINTLLEQSKAFVDKLADSDEEIQA